MDKPKQPGSEVPIGKWNKQKKESDGDNNIPEFLKKRLSENQIESPENDKKKPLQPTPIKIEQPVILLPSPSAKHLPKTPQHAIKNPLKDPKEEKKLKEEQRK